MLEFVSAPVLILLALGGTAIAAALYVLIKDDREVRTPHQRVQERRAKAPWDIWDGNKLRRAQRESQ